MKFENTKAVLLIIKNILKDEGECFWLTVIQEFLHEMRQNKLSPQNCLMWEESLWGDNGFFAYKFLNNEEKMTNREKYMNILLNDLKYKLYVAWCKDTNPYFKVQK